MQRIEPACPVGGDLSGCTEIDLDFFYIAGHGECWAKTLKDIMIGLNSFCPTARWGAQINACGIGNSYSRFVV
jgi:hypothetical protein